MSIKEYFDFVNRHIEDYGEQIIILMQNGAFYEVYGLMNGSNQMIGSKLVDFARICELSIVERKLPGDKIMQIDGLSVVNAGFKTLPHLIEKYIKKLQECGFTILTYDETGEDPVKRCKIRTLTGTYSPGTYFGEYETEKITNNICCLWLETKRNKKDTTIYMGVALIDIYTGQTHINEFSQEYIKNPTTFDDLECIISVYNPSESIIISNLPQEDIQEIIDFINLKSKSNHIVSLSEKGITRNASRAVNCEKQIYQTELLRKFYGNDITNIQSYYNNPFATQAFCYLLDFVFQVNPNLVKKITEPSFENASQKLILANHSLKQLHIIHSDGEDYKGKYSSVLKMLNECLTPMGRRTFAHQLLNPVTDIAYLQYEYNITEYVMNEQEQWMNSIVPLLVQVKDIPKIMRQIMNQRITPKYISHLHETILFAIQMQSNIPSRLAVYLGIQSETFLSKLHEMSVFLEQTFYLEECKQIDVSNKFDSCFIKRGVSETLDQKWKLWLDSKDQLEACGLYLSQLIQMNESSKKKDEDKLYVKIYETDKCNYSLLATERRCKLLKSAIGNQLFANILYQSSFSNEQSAFSLDLQLSFVKQSTSNQSIESSQINALCKTISLMKTEMIVVVSNTYQTLLEQLQTYQESMNLLSDFLSKLDVLCCKASIAIKYQYCKPEIEQTAEKSFVDVVGLRHCLIEQIQTSELYIPNNIQFGKEKDGILLYGTNAVGKTSFIRSLGIAVVMAQAGLFVPADTFRFHPYKYLFTRILGNDNIFKGLSTFEVEMLELSTILNNVNANSMVLGDELCSGTESISAACIFVAGIKKLAEVGCSFIFATHLHEIIHYDEIVGLSNVSMKHMSVIYNKELDCLVYNRKLQNGPGNNMYGLEVCKSLKLPISFLESANEIRMKYHAESSSILDRHSSRYNASQITGGLCEKCNMNPAVHVHHLVYQKDACETTGIIRKPNMAPFHKNAKANTLNICESCHTGTHIENKRYKKTKTTNGIILEEIA
jgi:DNA mismatch repair protein MutS